MTPLVPSREAAAAAAGGAPADGAQRAAPAVLKLARGGRAEISCGTPFSEHVLNTLELDNTHVSGYVLTNTRTMF